MEPRYIDMSETHPIASTSDLRRAGPSSDPWRRTLNLANRLSVDGTFTPDANAVVKTQVEWALTAAYTVHVLLRWPSSAEHSGDELYFRSLEHLFLQYEVFRLLRGTLTRPHTHWTRPCNGTCRSLLMLHFNLTHFREKNRPVEFVEDTIIQEPLHMRQQFRSLRQATIRDGSYNAISDTIARYVSRISALTIDDQEWYECAHQVNFLRLNHSQHIRFSSAEEFGLGIDGMGDYELLPTSNIAEGTYPRTRSRSTPPHHSRPLSDPASDRATGAASAPASPAPLTYTNLSGIRTYNTYPNARRIHRSHPYHPPRRNRTRFLSIDITNSAIFEPPSSPPLSSTPLLPRRVPSPSSSYSSFEETPLSPLTRPPTTRLNPLAAPFHSNAFAGALTPAEIMYLNRTEVALDIDRGELLASLEWRREIASDMQEALDRVGPVAGVEREEEWEERAAAMRDVSASHRAPADVDEESEDESGSEP